MDWESIDQPLIEFTAALARLRRDHPTFRRRRFFNGRPVRVEAGRPLPDIAWLRPDGTAMQPEDWDSGFGRAVGVFLNGRGIRERDRRGEPIIDKHFIVLFNAGDDVVDFKIPSVQFSPKWNVLVDTAGEQADSEPIDPGATIELHPKALVVLSEHDLPEPEVYHSVAASLTALADVGAQVHSPKPEMDH